MHKLEPCGAPGLQSAVKHGTKTAGQWHHGAWDKQWRIFPKGRPSPGSVAQILAGPWDIHDGDYCVPEGG